MVNFLHKLGWFVGMVLLQVLILNNIHLAGYATPFLYIYPILKMESTTSRNELMAWAFCLGLIVDLFSDTLGMNVIAMVWLAFMRPLFLRLFVQRDKLEALLPGVVTMEMLPFLKYVTVSVLLHQLVLFGVEYFSLAHVEQLLLRVVASTLLTIVCVMAMEGLFRRG